jgi:hypothetical protein
MFRYLVSADRCDIPVQRVIVAKIGSIGLLRVLVPLGGENTMSANGIEAPADAANPSEKIDEGETGVWRLCNSASDIGLPGLAFVPVHSGNAILRQVA